MISLIKNLFKKTAPIQKNTRIKVKWFNDEIVITYQGRILQEPMDYKVDRRVGNYTELLLFGQLDPKMINVRKVTLKYQGWRQDPIKEYRPWGFKIDKNQ